MRQGQLSRDRLGKSQLQQGRAIRGIASWQTTIADLSLILFLLSASALSTMPEPAPAHAQEAASGLFPSEMANASAIYLPGAGMPPLDQWLAEQAVDPRQRVTVLAHYAKGDEQAMAAAALTLLRQIDPDRIASGRPDIGGVGAHYPTPRMMLEAGPQSRVAVLLAYDLPDAGD